MTNDSEHERMVEQPVVYERRRRGFAPWLLAIVVIAAIGIGAFFLLGGSVDTSTEGDFDVDVPSVDVTVNAPDVDVSTPDVTAPDVPDVDVSAPDVDVDPGSVDVDDNNDNNNNG